MDNTGITLPHVAVGLGGEYAVKALAGDERVDVNRSNSREHALLHGVGRSGEGREYESAVCQERSRVSI